MGTTARQLVTLGSDGRPARPRRRDASRNRERILAAAEEVVAAHGHEATMEQVAVAAGVGKGTLYRNFASRSDLARALLDDRSRRIQAETLRAASPLAGGAPLARLQGFLRELLEFTVENLGLLCMASDSGAGEGRGSGAYVWQRQVVAALVGEAAGDREEVDVVYLADALLELVDPGLLFHQINAVGLTPERIARGIDRLAAGALASPAD